MLAPTTTACPRAPALTPPFTTDTSGARGRARRAVPIVGESPRAATGARASHIRADAGRVPSSHCAMGAGLRYEAPMIWAFAAGAAAVPDEDARLCSRVAGGDAAALK